jgi:hypothetical protein
VSAGMGPRSVLEPMRPLESAADRPATATLAAMPVPPRGPAKSRPAPGSLPKLPQTIFNLENDGTGDPERVAEKLAEVATRFRATLKRLGR